MDEIDLLRKKLERESKARKAAEKILEEKALELYSANDQLKKSNEDKDALIQGTSAALTALFKYGSLYNSIQEALDIIGPVSNADRAIVFFSEVEKALIPDSKYMLWDKHGNKPIFDTLSEEMISAFNRKLRSFFNNKESVYEFTYSSSDDIEKKVMDATGIKSGVFFPIYFEDQFIGIFGLEYLTEEKKWSENEYSILRSFSVGLKSTLEKKSSRFELENQKKFYESVLNSIPSDLVVFDNDHTYRFVNPIAIKNDEIRKWIIGKDDYDYVEYRNKPKTIADSRRKNFKKLIKNKEAVSFEEKLINEDGEVEWKKRYMYPVLDTRNENVTMVIGYAIDITDIKETQEKITSISTRLSTLISSLNSGILLEDQDRRILVTNQNFCKIFEIPVSPDSLIGIDCSNSAEQSKHLIDEEELFVERINKIVKRKEVVTNEEIHFKDGRVFERDFIPIYNNEQYLGHLWEYRDITAKKESELQLIRAREEAEESKRLKQRFLANMSHEIRTPMNGVIGIVHLLERTQLQENQKKYLNILKDSSEHLLHIINDILDVSKIEEGKLELVYSPVQIDNIIEGVIQNLRSRIKDKKLRMEVSGLEIFDTHFMTDPVRLRQILLNLMSNAIKFTHKGKISVNCSSLEESSTHLKVKIEIKDTGIGIPERRLKNIFEAFNQAENSTSVQYGGSGLGLNIVKDLVHKMKGSIDVESKENVGSSFSIILTLEKVDQNSLTQTDFSNKEESTDLLKGAKILVADDHEVNFTIAKEIVGYWGADVFYAKDGEEAVNKVIENDFDLVLMDMQMPNIDGIEATKMIRLLDAGKADIPIIAMTAAALPEERERCLQSGMNDYISKPYSPNKLYDILINYISDHKEDLRSEIDSLDMENDKNFDLSYLKEVSGNNDSFIIEIINSFIRDMPAYIDQMNHEINQSNFKKVSEIAHKSKSLASYLGCNSLRITLFDIEHIANDEQDSTRIIQLLNSAGKELEIIIPQLKKVELL